jgi:class 3 adenylate cyclase
VPGRRERKVVTVLFADLVGFTSRAEQMDPEDVDAELTRYHTSVRGELERHGGTVEKFIGDAAMAVFGAPVAHEDDPERAVRAALAVRDWAREEGLEVRIGINTGEALVRLDAQPEAGEGMAAGDVVNTAARLQAAAPIDGILVGEATFSATRQSIAFGEARSVEAKGKAQPVQGWEAVEARSRVAVERLHGASLVGRGGELALLSGAFDRARREHSVQLVTLVGVPGIGKSRLVFELFRILEADSELILWRHGRCLPYGEGVTFWALGEIVKAQAGILESDSRDEAERKLREAADDSRLESYLRPLVGLGGGELGAGELPDAFAAWRQFFEDLAERGPLVLVFEDLHWAGDELLDFVDHLVDWARGVPILVVCTARTELLDRRPTWGGGKPNALTISLSPLSDEETARLVGELLEEPPAGELEAELLARAGGNPLYAEQYARILRERGRLVELPETVQGIIAARLDLLELEHKAVLQDAAVIGRVFWAGGLATVSDLDRRTVEDVLHSLERADFVRRERQTNVAEETQYTFLHVLARDVAYAQIPRADRVDKHRRAAEWIESLGRREDHAEMLAYHYVQALELAEAARLDTADLAVPARLALRDAGDRAAALYSVAAAERFYDAALRLWPDDDPERVELLYRRAIPAGRHVGGGDPERLVAARDALLAFADEDRAAEMEALLAQAFWIQGKRELSDEHRNAAAALLGDRPPTKARAWVLGFLARTAFLRGELERAVELASEGIATAEALDWGEGISDPLTLLGMIRVHRGDAGGIQDVERGIAIASESGSLAVLARVVNVLAVCYQVLGDLESGYRVRLEGAQVAERLGFEPLTRWFAGVFVDHHYRRGEWEEAERTVDEFLARVESGSPHVLTWQMFAVRAEFRLARGDADGAIADAEKALEAARVVDEVQAVNFTLTMCTHVFVLASERDRALEVAHELLDSVGQGNLMQFAVINLPAFAQAAVRLSLGDELLDALTNHPTTRWTEAVEAYVAGEYLTAADILAEAGTKVDEAEARLRAAEQLAAAGERAEAEEQRNLALAFYRAVGATRYIEEAEAVS